MLSDELYDLCLPVLKDASIEDEDKTDRLEDILKTEGQLTGKSLENSVLDALWRFRSDTTATASPPPSRHSVIRRPSPAPWQIGRVPTPSLSASRIMRPPPGLGRPGTASPFTSPRSSPRLALAAPHIPHSPRLENYEFSEPTSSQDTYGDLGSDGVDWLVNDDTASVTSSTAGDGSAYGGASGDWNPANAMDPYDLLRSILRDEKTNDEIEQALEENAYDLSATIMALMDGAKGDGGSSFNSPGMISERTVLVGKSMSPSYRPATPIGQQKSNILCKYWLSTGNCARADCRFSHDPSKTVCKYWLSGNCIAGEGCLFSHDPSILMSRMMIDNGASTPPASSYPPSFQLQDFDAFPSLQSTPLNGSSPFFHPGSTTDSALRNQMFAPQSPPVTASPGLNPLAEFMPSSASRPQSRPTSRHTSRAPTPSLLANNNDEAFPALGAAVTIKVGKKHHGKRGGHGHHHGGQAVKEAPTAPGGGTLADLVRMSPSPSPAQARKAMLDGAKPTKSRSYIGSRENSEAARAILPPENIPWLQTGDAVNKAYLKARGEAFKHGGLRNKFLQSAAQAYNRHDSRAAKALSIRGQAENNLMREAHREAARILYEERNKELGANAKEVYVDLHGLHPEESTAYLAEILTAHHSSYPMKPIYAITGTAHHSKQGRDKIGKAIRQWLIDQRFAFREFSVPGDRGGFGGIIGVDPSSSKVTVLPGASSGGASQNRERGGEGGGGGGIDGGESVDGDGGSSSLSGSLAGFGAGGAVAGINTESTKVRILRREDIDAAATVGGSEGKG